MIQDHKDLLDRISLKPPSLDELEKQCDILTEHPVVNDIALQLGQKLITVRHTWQQQLTIITTNIQTLETYLLRLRDQPESIQSVTLADDTLASIEMPSHEVVEIDDDQEKESEVQVTEIAPVLDKTTHLQDIETQTSSRSENKPSPTAAPVDEEQQTSFPLESAPTTVVDTHDHSMQTVKERKPTENITVTQTYTNDGHETIQFESGPNPTDTDTVQDVFVDATYQQVPAGQTNRSTELLLRNVPQTFETTFVEPNETTTEVIVEADGTKRIIVRKLTQTMQQVTQHQQHQQFTTISTLHGDDMVPISESMTQIKVANQCTTDTTFGDTGSKTVVVSQEMGSVQVGTAPEMTLVHEYETVPLVQEFETVNTTLKDSSTNMQDDPNKLDTPQSSEIPLEESSSIQTVVHQVTRRIIQRRRRIIKRVVIIDGVEHVTEEIIDEPDEVEITEEEAPQVNVKIVKLINGKTVVADEHLTDQTPVADEHTYTVIHSDPLPSQVFEHIIAAPVESITTTKTITTTTTSLPEAPETVIHALDHSEMPPDGIVEPPTLDDEKTITQLIRPIHEHTPHEITHIDNIWPQHHHLEDLGMELSNKRDDLPGTPAFKTPTSDRSVSEEIWPSNMDTGTNFNIEQYSYELKVPVVKEESKPVLPIEEIKVDKMHQDLVEVNEDIVNITQEELEPIKIVDDSLTSNEPHSAKTANIIESTEELNLIITNVVLDTEEKTSITKDNNSEVAPTTPSPNQLTLNISSVDTTEEQVLTEVHGTKIIIKETQETIENPEIIPEPSGPIDLIKDQVSIIINPIEIIGEPQIKDEINILETIEEPHSTDENDQTTIKTTSSVATVEAEPQPIEIIVKSPVEPEPSKPIAAPRTQQPSPTLTTHNLDVRSATQLFLDHETISADPTTQTIKVSLPSSGNQSPGTVTVTMTKTGDEETPNKVNVHITEKQFIAVEPELVAEILTEYVDTTKSEDSKRSRKKKKRIDKTPTPDVKSPVQEKSKSIEEVAEVEISPAQEPINVASLDENKAISPSNEEVLSLDPSVVDSVELNVDDDNTLSDLPEIAADCIEPKEEPLLREQEAVLSPDESCITLPADEFVESVKIVEESVIPCASTTPPPLHTEIVVTKSIIEEIQTEDIEQQTSPTNEVVTDSELTSVNVSLDIRSTQTSPEERKELQEISMQTTPEPIVEQTTSEAQTLLTEVFEVESQTTPKTVTPEPVQEISVGQELTKNNSTIEVQTDDVNIVEAKMTVITTESSNQTIIVDTREQALQTSSSQTPVQSPTPHEELLTEDDILPEAKKIVFDILNTIPITVDTSNESTNTNIVTITETETQTSLEPTPVCIETDDFSIASSSTTTTTTDEPYELRIEATFNVDTITSHDLAEPTVIEVQKSFTIDEGGVCREEGDDDDIGGDKDAKKKKKRNRKKNKKVDVNNEFLHRIRDTESEMIQAQPEIIDSVPASITVVEGDQTDVFQTDDKNDLNVSVVDDIETCDNIESESKEEVDPTNVYSDKIVNVVKTTNIILTDQKFTSDLSNDELGNSKPNEVTISSKPTASPRRVELTIITKQHSYELPLDTEQLLQSSSSPTNVVDETDLIVSTHYEPISNIAHDILPIEQADQNKPKLGKLTITKTTISDTKLHKTHPTTSVTIEEALSPTEELDVPLTPGMDSAEQYERAPTSIWTTAHQLASVNAATKPAYASFEQPQQQQQQQQWTSATALVSDRVRNIGTLRSTHLSNVLHLASLSENVTEEPIENRIEALRNNVVALGEALNQKDATITQTTVISIIETVSTWLETIEYRVYLIRQQSSDGPSEDKVKAFNDLSSELQHIAANVQEVSQQIKQSQEFVTSEDKKRMANCFQTLQSQVKAVEEITKENEDEAQRDLNRWNEYITHVEQIIVYVHILQERFTNIVSEDISIEEKLFMLDELELANKEHSKDIRKLLSTARTLSRDFPDKKIPQDIYGTHDVAKNLENNIYLERSRLLELQSLAEEYEQTLKEFAQITILADSMVDKPIVAATLEDLQKDMQNHRKFFVNLSHCRSILESLEVNLDKETREKHSEFRQTLHDRASNLLDKAADRAQRLSQAASRWTVLEKGMRDERQWLQVAQQRVPDLSAVTSADYDRYMTMYQSLSNDISVHYAKQVHLTNQATLLQEFCKAPNLEDENNESLAVLMRLREEVSLYLRRLQSFSDTWTVYDSLTDRLELWIKDAEHDISQIQLPRDLRTQPIENMRQFWEVKVHYEVHNNIRTTVGNKLEQALQILPLADEMLQRQFHSQLEDRWNSLTDKINSIQSSIVNSISAQDMSIDDKLIMLERELKEVQLNITQAKGVIKNEDELNLYIERMQVLKSRISIINNELGRIGMLPSTKPEHIGDLFGLSHRISTQIADELESATILKEQLIAIQLGIDRIRHQQQENSVTLDTCESHEKMGSEHVQQALLDCQSVTDELVGQWQQIMDLRQLLHTLPMRLRVAVSPVKLERDISQLQDDHALLESRCSNIMSSLRGRLALWRRFERQLEMVQQSVDETDYMMELLKVNGSIDYERLLKATERLEVSLAVSHNSYIFY